MSRFACRPARFVAQALLAGFVLGAAGATSALAGPSEPRAQRIRTLREKGSPLRSLPEPSELSTISRYLRTMGYEHHRVDEAQRLVHVRVRGENGLYDLYLLPRASLLHLQIPRLYRLGSADRGRDLLQGLLLELNWLNLVGKYSWDPQDGEVRYSYAHLVPGGLRFDAFALAVAQCLATVDSDMPRLRKLHGQIRGGEVSSGAGATAAEGHPADRPVEPGRRP